MNTKSLWIILAITLIFAILLIVGYFYAIDVIPVVPVGR